jgi:hypothetical protein
MSVKVTAPNTDITVAGLTQLLMGDDSVPPIRTDHPQSHIKRPAMAATRELRESLPRQVTK